MQGLAGVSVSALEFDDVDGTGTCGQDPYPLTTAVSNLLQGRPTTRKSPSPRQNPPALPIVSPKKHLLCSISDKSTLFSFADLDASSSFLAPSSIKRLKMDSPHLKIISSWDLSELNATIELHDDIDGINIHIDSDHFSGNVSERAKIQIIRQSWPKDSLLIVSLRPPTDPAKQTEFFQMIELHQ
jgi:hypothetical protein